MQATKYFLFLSDLLGKKVIDASNNRSIGRISEVVVTPKEVYPELTRLVLKRSWWRGCLQVNWSDVLPFELPVKKLQIKNQPAPNPIQPAVNGEICLKENFLDKQIVDVSGCKVVRVNDLHLLKENNKIWLVHVDVGFRAILRRLGWLDLVEQLTQWLFSTPLRDKWVSWKYVQQLPSVLEEHLGASPVKLKSSYQCMRDLHPVDMADILISLPRNERGPLFKTLALPLAAETLAEIKPDIQRNLLDSLDRSTQKTMLNMMAPDKAADLISRYPLRRRNEILKAFEPVKAEEIKNLLTHPEETAGALMTTKYVALSKDMTVLDALNEVKKSAPAVDGIYYIYVIDESQLLLGMVTLRKLLASPDQAKLSEIMNTKIVKIKTSTRERTVANIFIKYNFMAIPVVDNQNKIKGIVMFKEAVDKVLSQLTRES